MKKCGFAPQNIIDVGANVGKWTEEVKIHFPQTKFLMIEANEDHFSVLKATKIPFEIALVGETTGLHDLVY